jgi:hypothetical protein
MLNFLITGIALVNLLISAPAAEPSFSCQFAKGKWQPKDWIMVKCPYFEFFQDHWVLKDDCIQNPVPNRPMKDWATSKGDETYTSMVYSKKFKGNLTIKATIEFESQLAPLVVLSNTLGKTQTGTPEYRNYTEIVLYNEGVNVWTHATPAGKPTAFQLTGFNRFPLKPKTKYLVEISKKNKNLIIRIDGHYFGAHDDRLPEEFYLGVTACEGINRFYDLSVGPLNPKDAADPFTNF